MNLILVGLAILAAVLLALPFLISGSNQQERDQRVSRRWLDDDMRRRH